MPNDRFTRPELEQLEDRLAPSSGLRIVIDPGHGGSGAVGGSSGNNATGSATGNLEKHLTLDLAQRLQQDLQAMGYQVQLTRTSDVNLGLHSRAQVANQFDADFFLSLHFNGFANQSVRGTETFVRSSSDNFNFDADHIFAQAVQFATVAAIPGAVDRGVKQERFGVLFDPSLGNSRNDADVVSALLEVEFITNPTADNYIGNPSNREFVASRIATGIENARLQLFGTVDSTDPMVQLSSPHSGIFQTGDVLDIRGSASDASGISHVWIELYKGGRESEHRIGQIYQGQPGDGAITRFQWQIPMKLNGHTIDGSDYKIKWIAFDDSSAHNADGAYSSGYLTIRPPKPTVQFSDSTVEQGGQATVDVTIPSHLIPTTGPGSTIPDLSGVEFIASTPGVTLDPPVVQPATGQGSYLDLNGNLHISASFNVSQTTSTSSTYNAQTVAQTAPGSVLNVQGTQPLTVSGSIADYVTEFTNRFGLTRQWLEQYAESLHPNLTQSSFQGLRDQVVEWIAYRAVQVDLATIAAGTTSSNFDPQKFDEVLADAFSSKQVPFESGSVARLHGPWDSAKPTIILVHGVQTSYGDQNFLGSRFEAAIKSNANVITLHWGHTRFGNGLLRSLDYLTEVAQSNNVGDGPRGAARENLAGAIDLHLLLKLLDRVYGSQAANRINVVAHSQGTVVTTAALSLQPPNQEYDLNKTIFVGANLHDRATLGGQEFPHILNQDPDKLDVFNITSLDDETVLINQGNVILDLVTGGTPGRGAGNSGFASTVNVQVQDRVINDPVERLPFVDLTRKGGRRHQVTVIHSSDKLRLTDLANLPTGGVTLGWWDWLLAKEYGESYLTDLISVEGQGRSQIETLHGSAGRVPSHTVVNNELQFGDRLLQALDNQFDLPFGGYRSQTRVAPAIVVQSPPTFSALTARPDPVFRGEVFVIEAANPADADNDLLRMDVFLDANDDGKADPDEFVARGYYRGGPLRAVVSAESFQEGIHTFLVHLVDAHNNASDVGVVEIEVIEPNSPPQILPAALSSEVNPHYWILPHRNGDVRHASDHYALARGRVDVWEITPQNGGGFNFQTTGNTDTALGLYDGNTRQLIAFDEDNGSGLNASITATLNSNQTYFVVVGAQRGATGSYGLDVTGINQTLTATLNTPSPFYSAMFADSISPANELDYFRLTAPAGSTELDVSLDVASTLDGLIRVENQLHQTVATAFLAGQGSDDLLSNIPVTPGEDYFVTVAGLEQTAGNYNLIVNFDPDDSGLPPEFTPVPAFESLVLLPNGTLLLENQAIANSGEFHFFLFSPKQGQTGEFTLETIGDLDTQIGVYSYLSSAQATLLESDDDSGAGTNARISRNLDGGNDYLVVARAEGSQIGSYDLSVSGPTTAVAELVARGLESSVTTNAAGIANNNRQNYYSVVAPDNATQLTANTIRTAASTALDVSLRITDAFGNTVGFADQGGAGVNESLVNVAVEAGTAYFITVHGENRSLGSTALSLDFDPNYTSGSGQEFEVNSTTPGEQDFPAVDTNGSGRTVVAWRNRDFGRIDAQRFLANGNADGGEFRVNAGNFDSLTGPVAVGVAPDGTFVVAWTAQAAPSGSNDLYFRRFNSSGVPLTGDVKVNGSEIVAEVAMALGPNGEFAIVWSSFDHGDPDGGIFLQRYFANGTKNGGEIHVNTTTADYQGDPDIAFAGNGTFTVVWEGRAGSAVHVFAQAFDANGNKVGTERQVTSGTNHRLNPSVASDADGRILVVWQGNNQDGNGTGIFGQHLTASGSLLGSSFAANSITEGDQTDPDVAFASQGRFIVTWQTPDDSGNGISAQQFDVGKNRFGPEYTVNQVTADEQHRVVLASDGQETFFFAWNSRFVGTTSEEVRGLRHIFGVVEEPELDVTDNQGNNADRFVDFGDFQPSSSFTTRTVTVGNSGNAPLAITGVEIFGEDASLFSLNDASNFTLQPGQVHQLDVTFTPQGSGTMYAGLRFAHNDTSDTLSGDGDQTPAWIALAADVTQSPTLSVSLGQTTVVENAGSSATSITITRNVSSGLDNPLSVTLTSSDTSEAVVPATVVIPSGQSSVTVDVGAVDDALLDGTQQAILTASASGFDAAATTINVTDHETLTVNISADSAPENVGNGATTATVMRSNTDISQPLTVNLTSSDTTEATIQSTVTIAANQSTATFAVNTVDDNLLDGTQTVTITATASGYEAGSDPLDVVDHETITVSIAVDSIAENAGNGAATATVARSNTDNGQALTVNLQSNDNSEATVQSAVTIAAGQSSASFPVNAVDDNVLDGTQTVTITASATGYLSGSDTIDVTDIVAPTLTLSIVASSIAENAGGGVATGTVARNYADLGQPLTVNLLSNDTSEVLVTSQVQIPAGQSSANFALNAVDDNLLDGTQTVTITASASGFVSGSDAVDVTDHETLTLSIALTSIVENAGVGAATGTVTRSNVDVTPPLIVNLVSNDTSEVAVAAQVVVPAGQSSLSFPLNAVDDNLLDGPQTATITASATGYVSGSDTVDVTDHETLTLSIAAESIAENAGSGATTGMVTRSNLDRNQPLTVNLASNDTSEITVPSQVVIAGGQSSVNFPLNAVDESLPDGTQTVTISVATAGYVSDSDTIDVTDSETPTLTLSIAVSNIAENAGGGATTGTVSRINADLSQPLTINLLSHDTSEATVAPQVVIPAGQMSVSFFVHAVDDNLLDGTQTVTITAAATGYVSGSDTIHVTDNESEPSDPRPTIDSVTNNGPVKVGSVASVFINASGGNQPLEYAFDFNNDNVFEVGPQQSNNASHVYSTIGNHRVNVHITDVDGDRATNFTVVTIVEVVNQLPIVNARGRYSVQQDAAIRLSSTASDPDGDAIVTRQWDLDGDGVFGETGANAKRGNEVGANPVFKANNAPLGRLNVAFRAFDVFGNVGVDTAAINIRAASFAVGADAGGAPHVTTYDTSTRAPRLSFFAYSAAFPGGVRVATGDVNRDGVVDVITVPGPGGGPHIRVFDGLSGQELRSFLAYAPNVLTGLYLASGDVNGDGFSDIITGVDAGAGPHVRVFSGANGAVLRDFFAYSPAFTGGVRVASGDVNGDGFADIITTAGPTGGPHIRVYSGRDHSILRDFFAYAPGVSTGLYVAAGDVNGDGFADIISGVGPGAGPHIKVFDGASGAENHSFFAYSPLFTGGARVASVDGDGDGLADIVTGVGPGGGPHVRLFSGISTAELDNFFAFAPTFANGIFVG